MFLVSSWILFGANIKHWILFVLLALELALSSAYIFKKNVFFDPQIWGRRVSIGYSLNSISIRRGFGVNIEGVIWGDILCPQGQGGFLPLVPMGIFVCPQGQGGFSPLVPAGTFWVPSRTRGLFPPCPCGHFLCAFKDKGAFPPCPCGHLFVP